MEKTGPEGRLLRYQQRARYTTLNCAASHSTTLYYTSMHCNTLHCDTLHSTVPGCITLYCICRWPRPLGTTVPVSPGRTKVLHCTQLILQHLCSSNTVLLKHLCRSTTELPASNYSCSTNLVLQLYKITLEWVLHLWRATGERAVCTDTAPQCYVCHNMLFNSMKYFKI